VEAEARVFELFDHLGVRACGLKVKVGQWWPKEILWTR